MTFDKDAFSAWLEDCGAQIQAPTNEWEVLRYRRDGQTSIVYTNKKGQLTWTGNSYEDHRAFEKASQPPDGLSKRQRIKIRAKLFERDGSGCWYCGEFVPTDPIIPTRDDFPSIEHLVPRSEGGNHALANLVLAHLSCNRRADNASLADKIKLRETLHSAHAIVPPWESVRAVA